MTPHTQTFIAQLNPGDIVAMATTKAQKLGVVRGYGKGGNIQVDLVGSYKVKGIDSNHKRRLVKVHLEDLPLAEQSDILHLVNKYKITT